MSVEIDFPRARAGPKASAYFDEPIENTTIGKERVKTDEHATTDNDASERVAADEGNMWNGALERDMCKPGLLALGCVKEVPTAPYCKPHLPRFMMIISISN
jgi:hypothetical protein